MFGLAADLVAGLVRIDGLVAAPTTGRAVRGLLPVQDRLVPLVHLAAAIDNREPPGVVSETAVLVRGVAWRIALEIDGTDDFVREAPDPVPGAMNVSWASGVGRHEGRLVPIVDLEVLVERLRAVRTGAHA